MEHSQSEWDAMHALIERRKQQQVIYTHQQWAPLIRCAKSTGKSYEVTEVSQNLIVDFKTYLQKFHNWVVDTSREKVAWTKVKHLHFLRDAPNVMYFQYNCYDEKIKSINLQQVQLSRVRLRRGRVRDTTSSDIEASPSTRNFEITIKTAYNGPLPISKAKHNDLLSLCK